MSVMKMTSIAERPDPIEGGSLELFSVLLSNFIPRERAINVAFELRERFGSISMAMRKQAEELRRVPGLCDTAEFAIHLVHQLYKETLREDLFREDLNLRSGAAVRYCREAFRAEDRDVSKVFYLREGRFVYEGPTSIGSVGSNQVYMREVIRTALFRQATRVLIVFGRSYGGPDLNDREITMLNAVRYSGEAFEIEIDSELVLTHQ